MLEKTRTTLFVELRRAMSGLAKKISPGEYSVRFREIVQKYARPLRECESVFEAARRLFCDNADVLSKVENADKICKDVINSLLAARPNLALDMVVKQIEHLLVFKRSLATRTTKQRKRARIEEAEETAGRALIELSCAPTTK